MGTTIASYT